MVKTAKSSADYILPLYMNGLNGRMLRLPAKGKRHREILLIYGHHAMLERWWGLVENLGEYGTVTMPDLPGFGGMESFRKISIKPNIDAYADYLAAFVKLRYKHKRVTILAVSFGFVVTTRMLQRYPELAKKVDILVSIVGFIHHNDLVFKSSTKRLFRYTARFLATRPVALITRYLFLNKFTLKPLYASFPNSRRRMLEITPEEFATSIDREISLWRQNDVQTHWLTTRDILRLDNCGDYIKLPVVHVVSRRDHYINNISVEQHMRQVFSSYRQFTSRSKSHVPNVIADKKSMAVLLPYGLRRMLSKNAQ